TTQQGLADDVITQILEDNDGNLWLGGSRGIFRVRKRDLNALAEEESSFVHALVLGWSEGMRAEECSGGYSPACLKTLSGLLCFATVRGLVMVDPQAQIAQAQPPSVFIEEVVVDGVVQSST